MHLIQVLLPTTDNAGQPFPRSLFADLRRELIDHFGGFTVYAPSAAQGFWEGGEGQSRDDNVIFEVMAGDLDEAWWRERREGLEREFRQDEAMIRAQAIRRLWRAAQPRRSPVSSSRPRSRAS